MEKPKRPRGRPFAKPKAGGAGHPRPKRVMLGLRVTPEIKQQLDDAAQRSGRSQSQEAELRLERSFDRQGLLQEVLELSYGPEVAAELIKIGGIALRLGAAGAATGDTKLTPKKTLARFSLAKISGELQEALAELEAAGDHARTHPASRQK